jgi:hypothetical protein
MDWLIWVIVIVLVVAILWWLMSRNKTSNTTASPAPAAMESTNTGTVPDPGAVTAGVAGLAGVTNLGKAAAEGSGPTADEPLREEERAEGERAEEPRPDETAVEPHGETSEPAVGEAGVRPGASDESADGQTDGQTDVQTDVQKAATPGLTVEEPVIAAPVVEEPVVDEPVVDTDARLHTADAGDVDDWQEAPAVEVTADDVARADDAADKAEWESSWTDAAGAPVHHQEYTAPHSPTLPGAETAAGEDTVEDTTAEEATTEGSAIEETGPSGHLAAEEPYGTGSSSTQREGHPVKAIAATMTYHDEDAADYNDVEADVWFESAAHAEAAGFRPPRRSRH